MEKKDKIQLGITGVLVIFLLFFLIRTFAKGKPPASGGGPPAVKAKEFVADQSVKGPGLYTRLEQEIKEIDFNRDPFSRQSVSDLEESQGLFLSGILWDEVNPAAIINDQIITVGGEINGKKIVEIRKNKVILEADGQTTELGLE